MRARTSCVIRKLNESSDQRAWNIEPPPLANFYEDRDEDGDEEEQKDEDVVITVTHQLRRIALLRRSVDWLCARGSYNPRESDFALTAGTVKRWWGEEVMGEKIGTMRMVERPGMKRLGSLGNY